MTNQANAGKFTFVSYQMNWPKVTGYPNGDPYYTAEAGTRRTSYGVNSTPDCFFDAANLASGTAMNSLSLFTTAFNTEYAKAPKAAITATHTITGTTVATGKVRVTSTITPAQTITGVSLFIAVCEKLTTKNAATNGEKEFHHVMMKMVPNAQGRSLTLTANTPVTVTDSAFLTGTHVEEMTDLEVVVWAQKVSTGEVLQSAWSTVQTTGTRCTRQNVSPDKAMVVRYDPAQKILTVSNSRNAVITLYDLSGRQLARLIGAGNPAVLPTGPLNSGCYIVKMTKNSGRFSRIVTITE